MQYKYYCDGAASLNKINGQYVREAGGWAWALVQDDQLITEDSSGLPQTSNNAMELTAINQALHHACKNTTQGDMVYIYSDSAYCINIFTSWISGWKLNSWTRGKKHEPIENLDLIKEIDEMVFSLENSFIGVRWVKVKGHSNDKWNNYVDELAVKAKKEIQQGGTIDFPDIPYLIGYLMPPD